MKFLLMLVICLCFLAKSKGIESASTLDSLFAKEEKLFEEQTVSNQQVKRLKSLKNGKPVSISLFYEALCPYCGLFITNQLFPLWKKLKGTGIIKDIKLIPFGNAGFTKDKEGNRVYWCQHGPMECGLNLLQSCVMKHTNYDFNKFMPIVYCIELARHPVTQSDSCVKKGGLSVKKITKCVNGDEGEKLEYQSAQRTMSIFKRNRINFVPFIMINGVYKISEANLAQENLAKLVVQKFANVKKRRIA